MLLSSLVKISLLFSGAAALQGGSNHAFKRRQHHSIARVSFDDVSVTNGTDSLEPRAPGSKWSWYDTEESGNAGACGEHIKNYEFVVARAQVDFKPSDCFKTITLELNGRTAQAVIKDICPICPPNGLDLSKGLFKHIAPNADGIEWNGNWWWGGEPPKSSTTTSKTKSSTSTWTPPPTSTSRSTTRTTSSSRTTRSTTRTSTTTTSSTSTRTSTSTTSTTSTTSSTSTTQSLVPTATPTLQSNLAGLQEILVEMGNVIVAA